MHQVHDQVEYDKCTDLVVTVRGKKPNIFHSKILLWKKVRLMLMLTLISWDSDKIEKHWSLSELWSVQSWEEAVQWNHNRITDDHRACKNRVRLRLVARKAIVQQVRYVQWNHLLLFCDDTATRLLTYDDYASLAHQQSSRKTDRCTQRRWELLFLDSKQRYLSQDEKCCFWIYSRI
jgi:hypothetical protein